MIYLFSRMMMMKKTKRYKDLAITQLFVGLVLMLVAGVGVYYAIQKQNLFYFTLFLAFWFVVGVCFIFSAFHYNSKVAQENELQNKSGLE